MNFVGLNILRFTLPGCKDKEIRKFEVVAKTQFLLCFLLIVCDGLKVKFCFGWLWVCRLPKINDQFPFKAVSKAQVEFKSGNISHFNQSSIYSKMHCSASMQKTQDLMVYCHVTDENSKF